MSSKPRKFRPFNETKRQQYITNHREEFEAFMEYTNQDLRKMCFDLIGRECNYCGFKDIRALTIDHISAGGSRERSTMGARGVYIKIITCKGAGYQPLCLNCQAIKRIEEEE